MSLLAWPPNDQTSESRHLDELIVGNSHFIHVIRWHGYLLYLLYITHLMVSPTGVMAHSGHPIQPHSEQYRHPAGCTDPRLRRIHSWEYSFTVCGMYRAGTGPAQVHKQYTVSPQEYMFVVMRV